MRHTVLLLAVLVAACGPSTPVELPNEADTAVQPGACVSDCAVAGQQECLSNGTRTCTASSGCLKWSVPVLCGGHESCVGGVCKSLPVACVSGGGSSRAFLCPESGSPFRLGDGLESFAGQHRVTCLANTSARPDSASGQVVRFSLDEAKSLSDLSSRIGVSMASKFGIGVWAGDLSARYLTASRFTRTSATFVARVTVQNAVQTLQSPALTAETCSLDEATFRARCGDSYVNSITTGGEFIAIITYEATTEQEARAFASALRFGEVTGTSGLSVSIEELRQKFGATSRLTANIIRRGGSGSLPRPVVGEVLDYALRFPTLVDNTDGSPVPVSFTTQTFPRIEASSRDPNLAAISLLVETAQERLEGVARVLASPADYAFPIVGGSGSNRRDDLMVLSQKQAQLSAASQAYELAVAACTNPSMRCPRAETLPVPPSVTLPRRLDADVNSGQLGASAAGIIGGCQQWTLSDATCTKCVYTSTTGLDAPRDVPVFSTRCESMQVGGVVEVTTQIGSIGLIPNGRAGLLQAQVALDVNGSNCGSGPCFFSNVYQSGYAGVSLTTLGVTPASGAAVASLANRHCYNDIQCTLTLNGVSVSYVAR